MLLNFCSFQDSWADSINEEDVEPKFKYHRLANDLKYMLNADVITCSAVHLKVWANHILYKYFKKTYIFSFLYLELSEDVFVYLTIKETQSTQILALANVTLTKWQ